VFHKKDFNTKNITSKKHTILIENNKTHRGNIFPSQASYYVDIYIKNLPENALVDGSKNPRVRPPLAHGLWELFIVMYATSPCLQ